MSGRELREDEREEVAGRAIDPLPACMAELAPALAEGGALGLLVVDATALDCVEHTFGYDRYRGVIEALVGKIVAKLRRSLGDGFRICSGYASDAQLVVLIPRPRSESWFYTDDLPRLAAELREHVAGCLSRIAYPFVTGRIDVPVGHGVALHQAPLRPETQIRRLVEMTQRSAAFEAEREQRAERAALERILLEQSVTCVFEPIIRLADWSTLGFEALARGPEGGGFESPLALFRIAERWDLGFQLDALCRRRALHSAKRLDPGLKLFLNILPQSIHDPEFSDTRLRVLLGEIGLAPSDLVLEISERHAISNYSIFCEAIDRFKSMGFGIALDDTGAGHASLEAALEISPDFLKLDMALIRGIEEDPQRQELLVGLQRVAVKMKATVIAEGIETRAECETVEALGITYAQGHLFGKGAPLQQPLRPLA